MDNFKTEKERKEILNSMLSDIIRLLYRLEDLSGYKEKKLLKAINLLQDLIF
jgi:hypothetical protein